MRRVYPVSSQPLLSHPSPHKLIPEVTGQRFLAGFVEGEDLVLSVCQLNQHTVNLLKTGYLIFQLTCQGNWPPELSLNLYLLVVSTHLVPSTPFCHADEGPRLLKFLDLSTER